MKFVLSHPIDEEGMEVLRKHKVDVYIAHSSDPKEYLEQLNDADAFIMRIATCNAEIMDACPKLKVIGRMGVGYDSVDVEKANSLGIPVVITPGANNLSVAEHVVALMFALAKNICESDRELRVGNWQIRDAHKTFELAGKKVGIVGVGTIGREVARICRGIGMRTAGLVHRSSKNITEMGCEPYTDLHTMLRDCDVIVLLCPLTSETRDLISAKEFDVMKPGAMLINCSRGPIVNTDALINALETGRLSCAGVDVYDEEPIQMSHPLLKAKNVICTPHSAALTNDSNARVARACVEGCLAVCRGEIWPQVASKTVYKHEKFC